MIAPGTGIGIIGSGWGARVQVPAFRAAGLDVVALAGSQAKKTQRIAAELDIPFATGDWRLLLERDDVALVSIVTPPSLHCEMSLAVLEAGRHVLCEKPTAFDAAEAKNMADFAATKPKQIALIDHELRFLPAIQHARQMVRHGAIGALRHAEVRFINSSRANLHRVWNWWSDGTQGGGILGAICSHQIDTLRFVLNDEIVQARGYLNTFVTERPVASQSGSQPTTRAVTSDDFASFHVQFACGGTAIVVASMVARMNDSQSMTLYGDAGTLRFVDGKLLYARPDEMFEDVTPSPVLTVAEDIVNLYPDYAEATVYMAYALSSALDGDRSALEYAATFRDGVRVQQVIDAVRTSSGAAEGWVRTE